MVNSSPGLRENSIESCTKEGSTTRNHHLGRSSRLEDMGNEQRGVRACGSAGEWEEGLQILPTVNTQQLCDCNRNRQSESSEGWNPAKRNRNQHLRARLATCPLGTSQIPTLIQSHQIQIKQIARQSTTFHKLQKLHSVSTRHQTIFATKTFLTERTRRKMQ